MMQSIEGRLKQTLDGARLVRFNDRGDLMAVWHGGVTINIYNSQTFDETTCFSLSNEFGEPGARERVDQHIHEIFEEYE